MRNFFWRVYNKCFVLVSHCWGGGGFSKASESDLFFSRLGINDYAELYRSDFLNKLIFLRYKHYYQGEGNHNVV